MSWEMATKQAAELLNMWIIKYISEIYSTYLDAE